MSVTAPNWEKRSRNSFSVALKGRFPTYILVFIILSVLLLSDRCDERGWVRFADSYSPLNASILGVNCRFHLLNTGSRERLVPSNQLLCKRYKVNPWQVPGSADDLPARKAMRIARNRSRGTPSVSQYLPDGAPDRQDFPALLQKPPDFVVEPDLSPHKVALRRVFPRMHFPGRATAQTQAPTNI
jgi:hypothetical protein